MTATAVADDRAYYQRLAEQWATFNRRMAELMRRVDHRRPNPLSMEATLRGLQLLVEGKLELAASGWIETGNETIPMSEERWRELAGIPLTKAGMSDQTASFLEGWLGVTSVAELLLRAPEQYDSLGGYNDRRAFTSRHRAEVIGVLARYGLRLPSYRELGESLGIFWATLGPATHEAGDVSLRVCLATLPELPLQRLCLMHPDMRNDLAKMHVRTVSELFALKRKEIGERYRAGLNRCAPELGPSLANDAEWLAKTMSQKSDKFLRELRELLFCDYSFPALGYKLEQ